MNTLILTAIDDTISISKATRKYVLTYLQDSQEVVKFLNLESQIQHEETHQNNQNCEHELMFKTIITLHI